MAQYPEMTERRMSMCFQQNSKIRRECVDVVCVQEGGHLGADYFFQNPRPK